MFKQTHKAISIAILIAFISASVQSPAYAQAASVDQMLFVPQPGVMVPLSPEYTPAYLKGIVIHPENALKFDFIIYKGDKPLSDAQKRQEYTKLTKYFLASLAIPDDDQWVNLSPYEKDRIIKDDFGKTEMGRDLLAQDYLLKQITASLIYPEDNLGKKFWDKVYTQAQKQYGTTNIPVNTFNKVWILPDDALIYEKGNTAYVLKNHLRVMLEEDYLSLQKHSGITSLPKNLSFPNASVGNPDTKPHSLASQIIKEIVLPELQREVNEDKNFAPLRQVYSGMLLATWYKRALKESLLSKIYANKAKVKGVEYASSSVIARSEATKQSQQNLSPNQIYRQYLQAYKKGVFNFIKEDTDKLTNETIPRKYFSGGMGGFSQAMLAFGDVVHMTENLSEAEDAAMKNEIMKTDDDAEVALNEANAAMLGFGSGSANSGGALSKQAIEAIISDLESDKDISRYLGLLYAGEKSKVLDNIRVFLREEKIGNLLVFDEDGLAESFEKLRMSGNPLRRTKDGISYARRIVTKAIQLRDEQKQKNDQGKAALSKIVIDQTPNLHYRIVWVDDYGNRQTTQGWAANKTETEVDFVDIMSPRTQKFTIKGTNIISIDEAVRGGLGIPRNTWNNIFKRDFAMIVETDAAMVSPEEIKAALTAAGLSGTQRDKKFRIRDNLGRLIETMTPGNRSEILRTARARINVDNLGQLKYLIEGDLAKDYLEYFRTYSQIQGEPDPRKWPELVKESFFSLIRKFLFAIERYNEEEKGILTKIRGADEDTMTMQGKNARNEDVVIISDELGRPILIQLLSEYEQEQSVKPETQPVKTAEPQESAPQQDEQQPFVEPEKDIIKISEAEDSIKDIVEEALKGKTQLETLSDEDWQGIALQIYEKMRTLHGVSIATEQFLEILKLYFTKEEMGRYIKTFLTRQGKQNRQLGIKDLVLIVERLHTFSFRLKDFHLRPEVLLFVALDWVVSKVGGSYKFYRDILLENNWIGPGWENAEADQQTVTELQSKSPKPLQLQSVGRLKAFTQVYGINDVPGLFKELYRRVMYANYNDIKQSIFRNGEISDGLRRKIIADFYADSVKNFNRVTLLRPFWNDYFFDGYKTATTYGGILTGEYDPSNSRSPRMISYEDLPVGYFQYAQDVSQELLALQTEQSKSKDVEFPLPLAQITPLSEVAPLSEIAPSSVGIRVYQGDIDNIKPGAYTTLSGLRSFQPVVGETFGYIQNVDQFINNVRQAFRKDQDTRDKILEFVKSLIEANQTLIESHKALVEEHKVLVEAHKTLVDALKKTLVVIATQTIEDSQRLVNIVSQADLPDFSRSLHWAADYMNMIDLLYKNRFTSTELNPFYFYYDGPQMKLSRVVNVHKLTQKVDTDPITKRFVIVNVLFIFFKVLFNLEQTEVYWPAVHGLTEKDFKGEDLIVMNDLIDFLEREYNSQSTLGEFIQRLEDKIKSIDAAMRGKEEDKAMRVQLTKDYNGIGRLNEALTKVNIKSWDVDGFINWYTGNFDPKTGTITLYRFVDSEDVEDILNGRKYIAPRGLQTFLQQGMDVETALQDFEKRLSSGEHSKQRVGSARKLLRAYRKQQAGKDVSDFIIDYKHISYHGNPLDLALYWTSDPKGLGLTITHEYRVTIQIDPNKAWRAGKIDRNGQWKGTDWEKEWTTLGPVDISGVSEVKNMMTGEIVYNKLKNDTATNRTDSKDNSMTNTGGIDLNAANLNLIIKRDGNGVPLPLAQQDLAQLSNIQGLDPVILSIKPASQTALFSQIVGQP